MLVKGWLPAVSLVVCALGVPAQAAEPKTDALIAQAQAQYAELNFEGALQLLGKAIQVPGNQIPQLVQIYHLMGLSLGALGRYHDAEVAFARLLSLDPSFRLGTNVSPRVRAPFDELVKKNPKRLEIRLLPPSFAEPGKPVVFQVEIETSQPDMIKGVQIWHRRGTKGSFSTLRAGILGAGKFKVTLPAPAWEGKDKTGPLSWYAFAEGDSKSVLKNFGDAGHPLLMDVATPDQLEALAGQSHWYQKWWVWTLIGGAIAAATVTTVVLTSGSPSGPFDFSVDITTGTGR